MNQKICAVIIAAWQSEEWIKDCVEAVLKQRSSMAWKYELRLGIDGCSQTRAVVDKLGYAYYWSPKNVGAYVMRNSLMAEPADAYAVFDADDMMMESYLAVLLQLVKNGIAGAGRITIDERGRKIQSRTSFRQGVCVISKEALRRLGGYREERIASDADLIARAKALGVPVNKASACLYYRRKHPASLTQHGDTGMKSTQRRSVVLYHKQLRDNGELVVQPVVTPLTYIKGKER